MSDYIRFPVDFVEEVTATTTVQDVLNVMARWLPNFLPAERGSIALLEPDNDLAVYATNGNEAIPTNLRLPREGTHLGRALDRARYSIANDLRLCDELDSNMLVKGGLMSAIVVPLISGDRVFGTLNAASAELDAFNDDHGRIATVIARWLAVQLHVHMQIEEMRVLAETDPLTGILNRRAFLEAASDRLLHAFGRDEPVSVILLDLDWFKTINDTHGHSCGDAVLCSVTDLLRKRVRADDLFGRLGGEEFVLLTSSDIESATQAAEQLRNEISSIRIAAENGLIQCTASFGLASREGSDRDIGDLIGRADKALYRAKNKGRNRVETIAA